MLKIVLLGYGELAQSLLLGILKSKHKVVGVMRWKNNPSDLAANLLRDSFMPCPLTSIIRSENIYEIKADRANSAKFAKEIKKLKPDVILVGTWGEIINEQAIKLPKIAFINCHPSMLPEHRGSNPYASVIRNAETKTGVTFHLMSKKLDAGDILLQKELIINEDDTGESLKKRCAFAANLMIEELFEKLENAQLIPQKQDESKASYYPVLKPEDACINWDRSAVEIHNEIRGLYPWIKSFTLHENTFLYILSTKIVSIKRSSEIEPGTILHKKEGGLVISTKDPDKAILAGNLEAYGILEKYWTNIYVKHKIKVGDCLQ